jgi:hypothetical protein
MDPLAIAAKIVLAIVMMAGGLIYTALRFLADAYGDPDQGFLHGFGPLLVGLSVAVAGALLLIF